MKWNATTTTEIAQHFDDNIETKRNGERTETGFEITRLDKMIKESFDEGTKLAFTLRPQDEVAIETDSKHKRIDEIKLKRIDQIGLQSNGYFDNILKRCDDYDKKSNDDAIEMKRKNDIKFKRKDEICSNQANQQDKR